MIGDGRVVLGPPKLPLPYIQHAHVLSPHPVLLSVTAVILIRPFMITSRNDSGCNEDRGAAVAPPGACVLSLCGMHEATAVRVDPAALDMRSQIVDGFKANHVVPGLIRRV